MIKKQIWRPDTCECVIEQSFDYSVQPPILVGQGFLKACSLHSNPSEALEYNQLKNNGLGK